MQIRSSFGESGSQIPALKRVEEMEIFSEGKKVMVKIEGGRQTHRRSGQRHMKSAAWHDVPAAPLLLRPPSQMPSYQRKRSAWFTNWSSWKLVTTTATKSMVFALLTPLQGPFQID